MPIPPYATLMLPILRLAAERTWTYRELIKQISDDFRLTESERKEKTSDGSASVIDDQVHRARMDLKDRGLIEKSREAYLQISTSGRRLLVSNPHGIDSFPLLPSPASITSPSEPKGKDGTIAEPSYGLFAGTARKYEEQILAAAQSLDEHLRDLLLPKILEKIGQIAAIAGMPTPDEGLIANYQGPWQIEAYRESPVIEGDAGKEAG